MDELKALAKLIDEKNTIETEIAALIHRPALIGHVGEYIAACIFDIRLMDSASHKAIDGYFQSGSLAGKSVNVKWYGKMESLLDITPETLPDIYLVITGPKSTVLTSRGGTRPWTIDHVYLFQSDLLVEELKQSGVQIGIATSVRKHLWEQAEIYPQPCTPLLPLSPEQIQMLKLFQAGVLKDNISND